MAVLEKIRSKLGILASIIIGLAMLGFILSDFLGGGKSILTGERFQIAEISGKKIQYQEYDQIYNHLTDVYKFSSGKNSFSEEDIAKIREESWQQLVDDYVLGNEYKKVGISVCGKELLDLAQGPNPHPFIREIFTNPETKVFNRSAVIQFIKSLEQEPDEAKKNYWIYIENYITRQRFQTKYLNLISKGLYITNFQINNEIKDNSRKVSFDFLVLKYNTIADSTISVKLSEIKKYLSEHSKEFEQEASRDIEYITFDIIPSQADFDETKKWVDNIKDEFYTTSDIKQFVNLNSDVSFNDRYLKKDELPDSIKDLYDAKLGSHIGPYYNNGSFVMARLIDAKNMPDSVRARHILIRPKENTKEAYDNAKSLADSLLKVLKKGADFAALAKEYSADGSASKGGDLGWFKEGQMIKSFTDTCFNTKKGELKIVESQFGIHIVQVTERGKEIKKVQVAVLERKVEPSEMTIQAIYQKANSFAGTNNTGDKFKAALEKSGQTPQVANYLNENMNEVPGIPGSRELVRWAFKAESNTISGVMEFGNKFVIARLSQVRKKGVPDIEQIKDQLIALVRKEKKVKILSDKLHTEMKNSMTLNDLALKLNTKIDTAYDMSFSSYAIPTAGFEPGIIAVASVTPLRRISEPLKGNNGVFVIEVFDEKTQDINKDLIYNRIIGMYQNRVNYECVNTLKKLANIKDYRGKFF